MGVRDEFLKTHIKLYLRPDTLRQIARNLLTQTAQRLEQQGVALSAEEEAVELLCRQEELKLYGARPLRRTIAAQVETPAAELLLLGKVGKGGKLRLCARNNALDLQVVS